MELESNPIFDEDPFSDDENSSIDEIRKILREKGVIHTAFAEYEVITELSRVGRKWCYESYVAFNGKRIDELVLPSEHGSSKAVETEEVPPAGFVKRVSRKHLESCEKVRELIKEEKHKKGERRKRKIIKFLAITLLLALIAGGSYLFVLSRKPKEERHVDSTADSPQLILEYTTIQGKVEPDQHGIPTIILKKTDVVTINVVDPNTGGTIAQGVINIKLADTITDDTGKTAQDSVEFTLLTPVSPMPATPAITPSPTMTSISTLSQIEQKLKKADEYFERRRYTTPKNENAFEIYEDILRESPTNSHAREKLRQMAEIYKTWGDNAYQQGNYTKAKSYYQRYLLVAGYMLHTLGDEKVKQKIQEVEKRIGQTPTPFPF